MSKRATKHSLEVLRRRKAEAEKFLAEFAQIERAATLKQGGKTLLNRRKIIFGAWALDKAMDDEQVGAVFRRFLSELHRPQDLAAYDDPSIKDAFPELAESLDRHSGALKSFRKGARTSGRAGKSSATSSARAADGGADGEAGAA